MVVVDAGRAVEQRVEAAAGRLGMATAPFAALLAVTAVGLLGRLLALGTRVMHFDEARVAYWALRGARTGAWEYRYIVHGPLLQHVDGWLFAVLGPSDAVARLPVALVGGLLPLAALLYRDHLRDWEVAAFAGLLALNPILLYYSRFARSDVLVAAFALVAAGAIVRLHATRRPAHLYLAAVALALAFASKENAVVYLLCWIGALGLVVGLEILWPRRFDSREALLETVRERANAAATAVDGQTGARAAAHVLLASAAFLAVTVLLYAPRAPPGNGDPGLYSSGFVAVLAATVDAIAGGFEYWTTGSGPPGCGDYYDEGQLLGKYLCNLGRELAVLGAGAIATSVLAVVGGAGELGEDRPRVLVAGALFWGVASVLGYPLGSDILFPPWLTVHAIVPLAIPAAVGLVAVGRWTRDAARAGDAATAATSVLLVVVLAGSMVGPAIHHTFDAPTAGSTWDPGVVQYAQPDQDARAGVVALERVSDGEGTDVLVYDAHADDEGTAVPLVDMATRAEREPACVRWFELLPLSWHLYAAESAVACADTPARLDDELAADPPVVLTNEPSAPDVRGRLGDDYVERTYQLRVGQHPVVFFVDTSRVDVPGPTDSPTTG